MRKKELIRQFNKFLKENKILKEGAALDSEIHLKDSINYIAENSPNGMATFNLGEFGTHNIIRAEKSGGGADEPKADIVIHTESNPEGFGISMKAPNYDFLQNRMQKQAFTDVMLGVGVDMATINEMLSGFENTCQNLALEYAEAFSLQKQRLIQTAQSLIPGYVFPQPIFKYIGKGTPVSEALIATGGWRYHGQTVRSLTEIPTDKTRSSLREMIGEEAFRSFMRDIIAGGENNSRKAEGMLTVLVPEFTSDTAKIQSYLDQIITVDSAINNFIASSAPPEVRLIYRSEAASRTSKTESGRYARTLDPIADTASGTDNLRWTISIVKGKLRKENYNSFGELYGSLLKEELTRADKKEIKTIARKEALKEIERVVGKDFSKTIQEEIKKSLGQKATKQEVAEISKQVLKKLYREMSHSYNPLIDRIKL